MYHQLQLLVDVSVNDYYNVQSSNSMIYWMTMYATLPYLEAIQASWSQLVCPGTWIVQMFPQMYWNLENMHTAYIHMYTFTIIVKILNCQEHNPDAFTINYYWATISTISLKYTRP